MNRSSERKLIQKLRVLELRQLLRFAKSNNVGLKHVLFKRAQKLFDERPSIELSEKLHQLVKNVSIPLRVLCGIRKQNYFLNEISMNYQKPLKRSCGNNFRMMLTDYQSAYLGNDGLESNIEGGKKSFDKSSISEWNPSTPILPESPFFKILYSILPWTDLDNCGEQTLEFILNERLSKHVLSGRKRDGDYAIEIQIVFCISNNNNIRFDCTPQLNRIAVNDVEVGGRKSAIHYITKLCSLYPNKNNKVLVSWNPNNETGFRMMINLVKRTTVTELIDLQLMPQAVGFIEFISKKMSKTQTKSLKVSFLCGVSGKRITIPCRSLACTVIHFFDLQEIIKNMEEQLNWLCPICKEVIAYNSLIYDLEFRQLISNMNSAQDVLFKKALNFNGENCSDNEQECNVITID